ncbi:MAG: hypothetical protein AN484_26525, partial [Aphanizomenon flos-aquae WA102]
LPICPAAGVQRAVQGNRGQGSVQEADPRGERGLDGTRELHSDGGGLQGRSPFHYSLENLHEQRPEAASALQEVTERPVDERTLGFGGLVHSHSEHQRVPVCSDKGFVEILPVCGGQRVGAACKENSVEERRG